jgi:hypothetical protein
MKYLGALVTLAQSILILEILIFSDFYFSQREGFCGGKMKIFFLEVKFSNFNNNSINVC